jgi:hypothetical protein
MGTCRSKDLFEVVLGRSGAPLEIAFGYHHTFFVRVLNLLVAVVGHWREATQTSLLPLLLALSALFDSFDGGTSGCSLATSSSRTHVNQSKGGPNSLLTRGVSGCNIEQHLGGFRLLAAKLVDQRMAHRAIPKGWDDDSIDHTGDLVTFLWKTPDVILKGLALLLPAAL